MSHCISQRLTEFRVSLYCEKNYNMNGLEALQKRLNTNVISFIFLSP